jgi:hypothetical protein
MLWYNDQVDMQLQELKNSQDELYEKISEYEDDYWLAQEVDRQITLYKNISGDRVLLADKVDTVANNSVSEILIKSLDVEAGGFDIETISAETLAFSRLIYEYLSDEGISQITIKTAAYVPEDDIYEVSLEGEFK